MTVSYSPDDNFFIILFRRWKGSVWKLIWKWFLAYFSLYYCLYFLYHYVFEGRESDRIYFRELVIYVRGALPYYPLNFVLGFFVLAVVARWWSQTCLILDKCRPDEFMRVICGYLYTGTENNPRVFAIRRTFARWCVLLTAFMWRTMSTPVLKRFPTDKHLLAADEYCGLIPIEKWILPGIFCLTTLKQLYQQKVLDSIQLKHSVQKLQEYIDAYRKVYFNIWMCLPLVYTHVATIATHVYFLVSMLATQPVLEGDVDLIIPALLIFQFLFYMGWLLVAQNLFDPFGEDDEDLVGEVVWVHLKGRPWSVGCKGYSIGGLSISNKDTNENCVPESGSRIFN